MSKARNSRPWADVEDQVILRDYGNYTDAQIAEWLGRSARAIGRRYRELMRQAAAELANVPVDLWDPVPLTPHPLSVTRGDCPVGVGV